MRLTLPVSPQGPDGETPLIMATSNGHYEIVRLLVNAGADVNHADEVRDHDRSDARHALTSQLAFIIRITKHGLTVLVSCSYSSPSFKQISVKKGLCAKQLPRLCETL